MKQKSVKIHEVWSLKFKKFWKIEDDLFLGSADVTSAFITQNSAVQCLCYVLLCYPVVCSFFSYFLSKWMVGFTSLLLFYACSKVFNLNKNTPKIVLILNMPL